MEILDLFMLIFAGILAVPTLTFFLQVMIAPKLPGAIGLTLGRRPGVAVLVPAHNEASVIGNTLQDILTQLGEDDTLLVVADNCTDDTYAIARQYTDHVIERRDDKRKGKGYALDFGIEFLAKNRAPEVLIIIDADCRLSPSCIEVLAIQAVAKNRPIQALDLMYASKKKSVSQAVAEFAWLVKNQVRALGMMRLGLPCQLMGTGMAFPWELIRRADLAHGNMVEDMTLGIDLAILGFPPSFCPNALITSEFPASEQIAGTQRKRWEHGHLSTIMAATPALLKTAVRRRDFSLFAMALDLAIPPLSVLALSLAVMSCMTLTMGVLSGDLTSFALIVCFAGLFAVAVLSAWYRFGRQCLSFMTLCGAPVYILRKVPLYLAFLVNRQQAWVKTERR